MLKFDAETAALLNAAYRGADFVERRQANLDALKPRTGDHITDIGCGNGLLAADVARAVGESGVVTGVDPSPDMRRLAAEYLLPRERDHVELLPR